MLSVAKVFKQLSAVYNLTVIGRIKKNATIPSTGFINCVVFSPSYLSRRLPTTQCIGNGSHIFTSVLYYEANAIKLNFLIQK